MLRAIPVQRVCGRQGCFCDDTRLCFGSAHGNMKHMSISSDRAEMPSDVSCESLLGSCGINMVPGSSSLLVFFLGETRLETCIVSVLSGQLSSMHRCTDRLDHDYSPKGKPIVFVRFWRRTYMVQTPCLRVGHS